MDDHDTPLDGIAAADPTNADCPSREVLNLVGDRWSLLVLLVIGQGTRRNGALKRQIGGISQKMLTQTLRSLEANGLVRRKDFATVPPHVEYSLTELGGSLRQSMLPLFKWAETHFGEVLAARVDFKARLPAPSNVRPKGTAGPQTRRVFPGASRPPTPVSVP